MCPTTPQHLQRTRVSGEREEYDHKMILIATMKSTGKIFTHLLLSVEETDGQRKQRSPLVYKCRKPVPTTFDLYTLTFDLLRGVVPGRYQSFSKYNHSNQFLVLDLNAE